MKAKNLETFGTWPWLCAVIVVFFVCSYVLGPAAVVHLNYDTCVYLELADSLAAGKGYVFQGEPHLQYPPGFPTQLMLVHVLNLGRLWPDLLSVKACALVAVLLSGCAIRQFAGPSVAGVIMLLSIANWNLFFRSSDILSDIPFAMWLIATLYSLERAVRGHGTRRIMLLGVAAACGSLALLYRTAGIVLIPTVSVFLMLRAPWRLRTRLFAVSVLSLIWMMTFWGWKHWALPPAAADVASDPYLHHFQMRTFPEPDAGRVGTLDLVWRSVGNSLFLAKTLAEVVGNQPRWLLAPYLTWPIAILLVVGWAASILRYRAVWDCLIPFYLGMVLMVPWLPNTRLLAPLTPFLFWYAWLASEAFGMWAAWLGRRNWGWLLLLALPALAGAVYWAISSPAWHYALNKALWAVIVLPAAVTALLVFRRPRAPVVLMRWRWGAAVSAVLLVALATVQICFAETHSIYRTRKWKGHPQYLVGSNWIRAADFLKRTAKADATATAVEAEQFHHLTRLRCQRYPRTRSRETVVKHLLQYDYIVDLADRADLQYLRPAIRSASDLFALRAEFRDSDDAGAFRGPPVTIYEVLQGRSDGNAETPKSLVACP